MLLQTYRYLSIYYSDKKSVCFLNKHCKVENIPVCSCLQCYKFNRFGVQSQVKYLNFGLFQRTRKRSPSFFWNCKWAILLCAPCLIILLLFKTCWQILPTLLPFFTIIKHLHSINTVLHYKLGSSLHYHHD